MNAAQETIATGLEASRSIAAVKLEPGALREAPSLLSMHFEGRAATLIADGNTWAAAGASLEAFLTAAGIAVRRHVLPAKPKPKPSVELATELASVLATDGSVPVAVGSGVINDVVKYAAFKLGRPYLCVATAASMDGYTSAGAPLSEKGFKKTMQCRPAKVIIGDLDVLRRAPVEMSGWGYSDLAGKIPAGADWILADELGVEPVDQVAWPMVQSHLREFLSEPERVAQGYPHAIENLFAGLSVVGFAMEAYGSSRPASGADHQVAHLWEMQGLEHQGESVSHGSCVAIGSLAILQLYGWFLRQDIGQIDIAETVRTASSLSDKVEAIRKVFGNSEIAERSIEEVRMKHADPDVLRARLHKLKAQWSRLKARLDAQIMSPGEFAGKLKAAGAPFQPSDIGIGNDRLRRTVLDSRFLRSRYTILDVLEETALLHRAVDELFPVRENTRQIS